jgi:hypothetical protein
MRYHPAHLAGAALVVGFCLGLAGTVSGVAHPYRTPHGVGVAEIICSPASGAKEGGCSNG